MMFAEDWAGITEDEVASLFNLDKNDEEDLLFLKRIMNERW
jgi:hypothetical protein